MDQQPQTFANHTRFHPPFHFFAIPVLGINAVIQLIIAFRHPMVMMAWWNFLVAAAIMVTALLTRLYGLKNQDRIIRLEETIRLGRVLPEDLRARIPELQTGQLIALRFLPDDEVTDGVRAVLAGEATNRKAIKRRARGWRPDYCRL